MMQNGNITATSLVKSPFNGPPASSWRTRETPVPPRVNHSGELRGVLQAERTEMVVFRIHDFDLFQALYGEDLALEVEHRLGCDLETVLGTGGEHGRWAWSGQDRSPGGLHLEAGEFLYVWSTSQACPPLPLDQAFALKTSLQSALNQRFLKWTGREIELGLGFAASTPRPGEHPDRNFFRTLNEARLMARRHMDPRNLALARDFMRILREGLISPLYQPIVDLGSGATFGWEALSRGPRDSSLASPLVLFDLAEDLGELFALEKVCREKAVLQFGQPEPGTKLFLNIHPRTMADPRFTAGATLKLLEQTGLAPENIVFEITERHSVKDLGLFHQTLDHYRGQGFQVAVDDAGTGYSCLSIIADIRPDYIKMDMSITQGIAGNPAKRAIMETMASFAEKIGSRLIAEGIETAEEAAVLAAIGVRLGQGYHLARPAFPKARPAPRAQTPRPDPRTPGPGVLSCSMPIGQLAAPVAAIEHTTPVAEARTFLEQREARSSLVIQENDAPVGLIMSHNLDKQLSSQYGVALYQKRPISCLMDKAPLLVDEQTPIEQVATRAMGRDRLRAYDDIIVVRGGRLAGVVPVIRLMDSLAQIQVEMAKGVNPLTGLPGNVSLERGVEGVIAEGRPFALIYADLDHFKVYNDTYGFKRGDEVIKLTAAILSWATRKHGGPLARLFHIGGDDFVCLAPIARGERLSLAVVRCFRRLVRSRYSPEDRQRGVVTAKGRDGVEREYPLMSISLGILEVQGQASLLEIGERAAHVKKYAKSLPGSGYVLDRRPPLGSPQAVGRT